VEIGSSQCSLANTTIAAELESMKAQLMTNNTALQTELDATKTCLRASTIALEDSKRYHSIEIDDLQRQHRRELDGCNRSTEEESRRVLRQHTDEMDGLQKRLENALEDEAHHRRAEMQGFTRENEILTQRAEVALDEHRKAVRGLENDLQSAREEVSRERALNNDLRIKLTEAASQSISLEVSMRSLRAHIDFLESDNKSQSNAFVDLETRLQNALRATAEANEKLREEESLRRKLHNQVQELKGNIRVFCRVRPALDSDAAQEVARINYPDTGADSKEVEVLGQDEKSSLGNITTKKNTFSFDRVFIPTSVNAEIFDEISQLVQSALDGYNVCIFCYGQTGSGKTYTMSAEDGMIPRAVRQIYDTAKSLEEKGWQYSIEGSFIEVYNENLNDLLGKPDEFDKKKHEIRHDMQKCKTTITDITTVDLDTPNKVESILSQAIANRSVAATKANERSSRSHSVFILKLVGRNATTGEKSEGTLNLVDLAGSERLSHSKATGDRLKETQNINKSLSCLGDVIGALGQGKDGGHVPYRNSKVCTGSSQIGLSCATDEEMLMKSLAHIFTSIFPRGKLENSYVRNDQSAPITSQRDFDEPQIRNQGECIPYPTLEVGHC
jgi:kinesin family member C1